MTQTGNVNNPFTYAGYQYDNESGLYYLNARYYDPVTARFITEDTYLGDKYDPLSLNLYTYCHNEPIMYVDPSGHTEAQLRDLVAAAEGEVGWNNETRTATVTINGVEKNFKIEDYKVEDGRIIIDSEMFDSMFSNDYVSVSSRVEPQRITATMRYYYGGGHEEITGSAPNNYPKSSYDIKSVAKGIGESILGSTSYVNEIKKLVQDVGAREAFNRIMSDVDMYNNQLDAFNSDNVSNFNMLVADLVNEIGAIDKEMHYFRNKLNRAPGTLDEMIQINQSLGNDKKWRLLDPVESLYHMQGKDGEYNLKIVSSDGHFEAVYDKNGILLTEKNDVINMGTYNYFSPSNKEAHVSYDVNPYFEWGNTDPSQGGSIIIESAKNYFINYNKFGNNFDAISRYMSVRNQINPRK